MDEILKTISSGSIVLGEQPTVAENVDEQVRARVAARLLFIQTEGRKCEGIAPGCDPMHIPSWYDPVAFKRAQELFKNYGTTIRVSQFYCLLLVYCDFESIAPLLVTGNSRTVSKLYTRYLSTMIHVTNWFTYDPFDPNSKAYQSLKAVRGFHRKVYSKMNEQSSPNITSPQDLWISQFAMCYAQFTFMGLMAIFPKELGFTHFTPDDFHAIFHFWRVIGYCLGVQDRFNLCAGTDEETVEFCRQVYQMWRPKVVAKSEPGGIAMTKGIARAMAQVVPIINYNAMLRYAAPFLGLNRDDYPLKSAKDYADYAAFAALFATSSASTVISLISSRLSEVSIRGSAAMRSVHERILALMYDDRYSFEPDERCPLHIDINYKTAFDLNLD